MIYLGTVFIAAAEMKMDGDQVSEFIKNVWNLFKMIFNKVFKVWKVYNSFKNEYFFKQSSYD